MTAPAAAHSASRLRAADVAVSAYTLTRPPDLVVGCRVVRQQIGAPTLPMPGAEPFVVERMQTWESGIVRVHGKVRGRSSWVSVSITYRCDLQPDVMALVVDERVEEG